MSKNNEIKAIRPHRDQLLEAEFAMRTFGPILVDQGLDIQDVMKREYWTIVHDQLRRGDELIIRASDGSWSARLEVLDIDMNGPQFRLLYSVTSAGVKITKDVESLGGSQFLVKGLYTVSFNPAQSWRVVRNSDNHVCITGLRDRDKAIKWAYDQIKADAA